MKKRLLIIDDEDNMLHMLQAMLAPFQYEISLFGDGEAATREIAENTFDFILCDVRMPGMTGLEFMERNGEVLNSTTVIMMSAYGSVDLAMEAMKRGAYDFISKPFKRDEVLLTLRKAEERESLRQENTRLKRELGIRGKGFSGIIGNSKALNAVIDLAEKVSPFNATVLITGESGTGKELFARGIHESSPRAKKPFLAINCGSIPENLLESELFGYAKGAFTGAERSRKGLFEETDGGTLFLDEIGELPLEMQVKLLRVLQEGEVRRIGDSGIVSVDVRIVAATARNLSEEVENKTFRQDLYYRLNVLALHLPPLRERLEDVPLLCQHFIEKFSSNLGRDVRSFTGDAMAILLGYSWPGNVRELENTVQRAVMLSDEQVAGREVLPRSLQKNGGSRQAVLESACFSGFSLKEAQRILEAEMIARALEKTGGNKSRAAEILEISYPSLLSKIKEYRL